MAPTVHRPPHHAPGADATEDPEPGLLPIDPDDGILPPLVPPETESDPPSDPEA